MEFLLPFSTSGSLYWNVDSLFMNFDSLFLKVDLFSFDSFFTAFPWFEHCQKLFDIFQTSYIIIIMHSWFKISSFTQVSVILVGGRQLSLIDMHGFYWCAWYGPAWHMQIHSQAQEKHAGKSWKLEKTRGGRSSVRSCLSTLSKPAWWHLAQLVHMLISSIFLGSTTLDTHPGVSWHVSRCPKHSRGKMRGKLRAIGKMHPAHAHPKTCSHYLCVKISMRTGFWEPTEPFHQKKNRG